MARRLDYERARSGAPKQKRCAGRITQPVTERQRRYLRYLAARLGIDPPAVTTKRAASARIELLELRAGVSRSSNSRQPPAAR